MSRRRQFINKWKTDYDYKTVISAFGALTVTVIFALYNGFLGIWYASMWYGTICIYYIILVVLRGLIIVARKKYRVMMIRKMCGTRFISWRRSCS